MLSLLMGGLDPAIPARSALALPDLRGCPDQVKSRPGMTNQHRVQFTALPLAQNLGSAVVSVDQRLTSFLTLALYTVLERVGNLLRRSFGSSEAKRRGAGR
jgi:hypothetical protein